MKIFLAGTGSVNPVVYDDIVNKYHPMVLESFFYMNRNITANLSKFDDFLLDSGAFTFMHFKKHLDFNEYQQQYIDFINKYDIKHFFELDIDYLIGYDKVKILRQQLEKQTGKQCIPVFHKERGFGEYKKMCQEYKYIAIGTISEYSNNLKILNQLVQVANQYGTKVHGLGFTRLNEINKIKFYSVDSTTWNNVARFGELHKFNGTSIKKIRYKGKRLIYNNEVIKNNLEEWCKFQKYMEVK